MTLSEMASHVCDKARQSDADSVAKCKEYLARRYEMIYAEELWRDAVWTFPFTYTPDDPDVPESWAGIYMFPGVVNKVVAVRKVEGEIGNVQDELLFQQSLDAYEQTGPAVQFTRLARCVTMLPEAFAYHDLRFDSSASESGIEFKVHYIDEDNRRQKVEGTLGGAVEVAADGVRIVERVTKGTTSLNVLLSANAGDLELVQAAADDTAFEQRLPIQLLPLPTEAVTLRALVKKEHIKLDDDNAAPELNGVDNCLMAFAHGDMLQRARQYGKAQVVTQEAMALLLQFKNQAVLQEANRMQVIPIVGEVPGMVDSGIGGKGYW